MTVHKASGMGKKHKEFWHCTVCGNKEYYGGSTGQTFEQARRKVRRRCWTDGHRSYLQLVDKAFVNWQRRQQQELNENPALMELRELTRMNVVLGRYGRFPK